MESVLIKRKYILENYSEKGYKRLDKLAKKHRKELQTCDSNGLYNFIVTHFGNDIFEALFFFYYYFTKRMVKNTTLREKSPSSIFRTVFEQSIEFKEIAEISSICVMEISEEIFIMDFNRVTDSLAFIFLVPFIWYRAFDKHVKEVSLYPCLFKSHNVFICEVDLLNDHVQYSSLDVICFSNVELCFFLEPLFEESGDNNRSFACPVVKFDGKADKPEKKSLEIIFPSNGLFRISLMQRDSNMNKIPILSFDQTFYCEMAKFYSMPDFFVEPNELIQQPKNGKLPILRYVTFRVKQDNFLRVFLISFTDHEQRTELFSKGDYFERTLLIRQKKMFLVGEDKGTMQMTALARFYGMEYTRDRFLGIDRRWFEYSKIIDDSENFIPIKTQNTKDSHSTEVVEMIAKIFRGFIEKDVISDSPQIKSLEILVEKVFERYPDQPESQIAYVYLYMTNHFRVINYEFSSGVQNSTKTSIFNIFEE